MLRDSTIPPKERIKGVIKQLQKDLDDARHESHKWADLACSRLKEIESLKDDLAAARVRIIQLEGR